MLIRQSLSSLVRASLIPHFFFQILYSYTVISESSGESSQTKVWTLHTSLMIWLSVAVPTSSSTAIGAAAMAGK